MSKENTLNAGDVVMFLISQDVDEMTCMTMDDGTTVINYVTPNGLSGGMVVTDNGVQEYVDDDEVDFHKTTNDIYQAWADGAINE